MVDDTLSRGSRDLTTPPDIRPPDDAQPARSRDMLVELAVVAAAAVTTFLHLRTTFFVSNDDLLQLHVADEYG